MQCHLSAGAKIVCSPLPISFALNVLLLEAFLFFRYSYSHCCPFFSSTPTFVACVGRWMLASFLRMLFAVVANASKVSFCAKGERKLHLIFSQSIFSHLDAQNTNKLWPFLSSYLGVDVMNWKSEKRIKIKLSQDFKNCVNLLEKEKSRNNLNVDSNMKNRCSFMVLK